MTALELFSEVSLSQLENPGQVWHTKWSSINISKAKDQALNTESQY